MANHLEPTTATNYLEVLSKLNDRFVDQAKMFDPDTVTTAVTGIESGTIQWDSTSNYWKKYNGTTWVSLTSSYAIDITGNSNTVDGKHAQTANFSTGGILYASDGTTISSIEAGGTTTISGGIYVLKSNGTSAPSWVATDDFKVGLADSVYVSLPPISLFNDYYIYFGESPSPTQYKPIYYSTNLMFNSSTGDLTASGNITAYSDSRLKTDLVKIDHALEKVCKLTGYTYTRIDTGAKQSGLLADDVKKVLPEVVKDGKYMALSYGNMMGLIVEAIKELKFEIEELKSKINP